MLHRYTSAVSEEHTLMRMCRQSTPVPNLEPVAPVCDLRTGMLRINSYLYYRIFLASSEYLVDV